MGIVQNISILMKIKKFFDGNKTILVALGYVGYRLGVKLGQWPADTNIDASFGGVALITLKAYLNRLLATLESNDPFKKTSLPEGSTPSLPPK